MKRLLPTFLLSVVFCCVTRAQSAQQVLKWINTVKADNHDFYCEIPFEYRNNEIVIKVSIGNVVYDYIFDTGGYNDITDEIQAKNNFPVLTTQTVGSSNRLKTKVNLVKVDSFKIGKVIFKDVTALQMNFDKSPTVKCTINGALIGAGMIKSCIWQIDYPNRKIIMTDQLDKLPNLSGAVRVPVTFNSRQMPYINAVLNGKTEKFMFDSGSSSLCIVTGKAAPKFTEGKRVFEINGASSEGGNGVVAQTVNLVEGEQLDIGGVSLKHIRYSLWQLLTSV